MESLPEVVLRSSVTHPNESPVQKLESVPKAICTCNRVCAIHGDASSVKSNVTDSAAARRCSPNRPARGTPPHSREPFDLSLFRVLHRAHPPRYFIQVRIDKVVDNVVKGVFMDGQYLTYQIDVKVKQLDYANRSSSTIGGAFYSFERRNSDIKCLFQQLLKDHPHSMVPQVPTKHYKIYSKARHSKLKKNDVKMYYRKRMFPMWLQYMANTEQGQAAHTLVTFLTGLFSLESLNGSAAASPSISRQPSLMTEVNQAIIHQRSFSAYQEDENDDIVQLKEAVSAFVLSSPTLEPVNFANVPSPSRSGTQLPFEQAYMVGNRYLRKSTREKEETSTSGESWKTVALQLFPLQRLAYRDLRTVER
jgi:hypothetical protein